MQLERLTNAEDILVAEETANLHGDEIVLRQHDPHDPQYEKYLGVKVRVGKFVVGFTFQGGVDVTFLSVLPFVQDALSRVQAQCGGNRDA